MSALASEWPPTRSKRLAVIRVCKDSIVQSNYAQCERTPWPACMSNVHHISPTLVLPEGNVTHQALETLKSTSHRRVARSQVTVNDLIMRHFQWADDAGGRFPFNRQLFAGCQIIREGGWSARHTHCDITGSPGPSLVHDLMKIKQLELSSVSSRTFGWVGRSLNQQWR